MDNLNSFSDAQLLALIAKDGSEKAFVVLFDRYKDKIYHYILKHVKSSEIAEEILSDIFMKLWEGRQLVDNITELAAFLHKVAFYKAMDFLRTTARQKRLQQAYCDYFLLSENVPDPESWVLSEEEKALLRKAILQLPPRQKEIYLLSREEGLTHEQIAKTLNLSKSTVNNHLVAALRNIAKDLATYNKHSLNLLPLLLLFL
ncbi:MAG: sigma-70 family RNA polymerase sigma factor [Chitinophagaceae bacterium]